MTSTSLRLAAVVVFVAACGPGATSAGPTSPAPPTAAAEPAPATPGTPATPDTPAPGAKRPSAPGPNLTPDGVVFNFKPDGGKGKKIFLAGNFNDWKPDNPQYLMTDDGTGTWTITVKLPPGTYQYKYVIDGTSWVKDPYSPGDAPDGFGGRNGKFDVK